MQTQNTTKTTANRSADQTSTILTLIRRGDSISQICSMLNVRRSSVEKIMDSYVERMMA